MPALLWASCGSQIISQIAGGILAPGGSPSRGSPARASSFVFLKLELQDAIVSLISVRLQVSPSAVLFPSGSGCASYWKRNIVLFLWYGQSYERSLPKYRRLDDNSCISDTTAVHVYNVLYRARSTSIRAQGLPLTRLKLDELDMDPRGAPAVRSLRSAFYACP